MFGLIIYAEIFIGLFTTIFFLMTFFDDFGRENRDPNYLPRVTVAVPTWNDADTIAGTIQSLLNLDYPKDKLEIIVVENNNSTDGTFAVAQKFEKLGVRVFSIKRGGKGHALNFALKHTTGELFGGLDSDSYVDSDALKKIVQLFADKNVMAVTPTLKVYKPKTIWQHIQAIEFLYGVFLRKVFGLLDSIHVTPGPFTIYRKEFFDRYGGYAEDNITEDIEVGLRIQKRGYRIENAVDANVYASSPEKFGPLFRQRVRWYLGFIENAFDKRNNLFGVRHGILGMFILPLAIYSIFFAISMFAYQTYLLVKSGLLQLATIEATGLNILNLIKASDSPLFYLSPGALAGLNLIILAMSLSYLYIAIKYSNGDVRAIFSYILYAPVYLALYATWWLAAFWQKLFGRELRFGGVVWKNSLLNRLQNRA
jgi:poly-beta-1,6-N-acetyl-D-glucosamine synthase